MLGSYSNLCNLLLNSYSTVMSFEALISKQYKFNAIGLDLNIFIRIVQLFFKF